MLKVHLTTGETLEVDLDDEDQARVWIGRFSDPRYQSQITGLTVVNRGVQYSLPRPVGFRDSALSAEPILMGKGGQRVFCFADDVRVTLNVHNGQRAARVQLAKPGKRKFNPNSP
jgi:hypothetical protein